MTRYNSAFRFQSLPPAGPGTAPGPIYGPVYYIGTVSVCAYLVETSAGLVLVDTGDEKDFDLISGNISKLGFQLDKIRLILNTHWHEDHTGGNAGFARGSGALVCVHEADAGIMESGLFKGKQVFQPRKVDRRLKDGETVRLGEAAFQVIHCPGQSPGSAVFLADIMGPDGPCRALFCGDATGFKCAPELYEQYGYPEAARDYRKSVEKLKALEFDLYLGGHPHQVADEIRKDGNPFISRDEWVKMVDARHKKMETYLTRRATGRP